MVGQAGHHHCWPVTLYFVAIFLKYGKMFSQDECVSSFDMIFAFADYWGLMYDIMHNVLIPIYAT